VTTTWVTILPFNRDLTQAKRGLASEQDTQYRGVAHVSFRSAGTADDDGRPRFAVFPLCRNFVALRKEGGSCLLEVGGLPLALDVGQLSESTATPVRRPPERRPHYSVGILDLHSAAADVRSE
jgi:hypothetical protein